MPGDSQFAYPCRYQFLDVVNDLLAHGANVSQSDRVGATALMAASWGSSAAIVEALLRAGANVNAVTDNGLTPLMTATVNEKANVVRQLLRAGAQQKCGSSSPGLRGETELMLASESCLPPIVDLLVR